ncbi:MAG: SDR family oxidoreductase [Desulfobacterales bacterium]|nr:SDR family oxidoreductase [Desulfobacterales bacterium]
MDLRLKGKIAVILASSAGIGKGVATVLAEEGCKIAICGRRMEKLQTAKKEIHGKTGKEVFAKTVDVSRAESLNDFFSAVYSEYGQIDILVNNAGGPPAGDSTSFTDRDYYAAFELSLMSVIRSCRIVLPKMKGQKFGRIITIASTSVKCVMEDMILSNTFRNAVVGFNKSLAIEAAIDGVRVHTLMPGPFMTDRVNELGGAAAKRERLSFNEWKKKAESNTPLRRFGSPEEIGQAVAFLSSELADYMNGTCIPVDGGILANVI